MVNEKPTNVTAIRERVAAITARVNERERKKFMKKLAETSIEELASDAEFPVVVANAMYLSGLSVRKFAKQLGYNSAGTPYHWLNADIKPSLRVGIVHQIKRLFS